MDWWKGNYERLDQEFDSREQWLEYFGGMSRESYLNSLRDDLPMQTSWSKVCSFQCFRSDTPGELYL